MAYSDSGEALCQACGLCCDGSLFSHVTLKPGEADALGGAVDIRMRKDGAQVLMQPCAALKDKCCTVYTARPSGCREFICTLWEALLGGEARLDESLIIVERAHQLIAALQAQLPKGQHVSSLLGAKKVLRDEQAVLLSPGARAALEAVERHVRFHFGETL